MAAAAFTETQDEHLARLGYINKYPIEDLLDVATYIKGGMYFHASDGRFCMAWRLRGVPDETLTTGDRFYFTNALSYAMSQYPVGSTGQILRYTHDDIRPYLYRYGSNLSDHPFAQTLANSVMKRQIMGASQGFFSNIDDTMMDSARAELLSEVDDADSKDDLSHRIENSTHTGRFAHTTDIFMVFCYSPYWIKSGFVIQSYLTRLMAAFGVGGKQSEYEIAYRKEERKFLAAAQKIQNSLAKNYLSPEVVTGQGMVEVLFRELNPTRKLFTEAPTYTPYQTVREIVSKPCKDLEKDISRVATYTPIETMNTGWKIDDEYLCVTSLRELPQRTRPGMLQDVLSAIEGQSWAALNFHVGNQAMVRARLKIRRTTMQSKRGLGDSATFMKPDSMLIEKNFQDLDLVDNATNPEERDVQLVVNASIHVAARSRSLAVAMETADQMEDLMWHYGYQERDRGDAVVHSMLPFNYSSKSGKLLQRGRDILTSNLADLAPIFIPYQGCEEDTILVNNAKGEPIFIALHGKHVVAGHSLIVGGTGSGKSFLINNLLMQMMAQENPKIFMIDKGGSYKSFCEASGGSYISLSVEEEDEARPVCLNPFYVAPDENNNPRRPRISEIFFMQRVVLSMIQSGTGGDTGIDAGLTKEDTTLIIRALREMFKRHPIEKECTLSDYVAVLRDFGGERGDSLAEKLFEFTKDGLFGALLDGPIGVNWDADLIVIETDRLDGSPAMSVIMLVLFYQIDLYCKYRLPRSRPKFVGIDEAWAALTDPTGTIPRLIGGYFREMRKYKCACALISQGLSDFVSLVSSEGKAGGGQSGILMNTKHFFLLSASEENVTLAKKVLNITDTEADLWRGVSSLPPFYSECFYRVITAKDEPVSGKFRLYSNPVALWLATTDPVDVDFRKQRINKHLPDTNGDRLEATRRAVEELAKEFPYGSKYKAAA